MKTSKDTVFPSLSKVSILNQYYHFKYDRSKKNLQKPFLLQEIDTQKIEKKNKSLKLTSPSKTPTHIQPSSAAAAAIITDLSAGDIYTALGLTEKGTSALP